MIVSVVIEWPTVGISYEFSVTSKEALKVIKEYNETDYIDLLIDENGGGYSATGTDIIKFESGGNNHGTFSIRRIDFNLIMKKIDVLLKDMD